MARWRALPWPARYSVMLLAGALPVLAFPAPNAEFIAWFGLVPGLLLIRASGSARQAAAAAWWFGAGYLLAALYLADPEPGPRAAAGRGRPRRAVGRCRVRPLGPAPAASHRAPCPRGTGRRAELLGTRRVDPVLAGLRRTVGGLRGEPVAASRGAGAGRRRRRLAGQLRPGRRQHRRGDPHHGRPLAGPAGWRGRRRRGDSRGAGRVRARRAAAGRAGPSRSR